jgi:hypothetical protein
MSCISSFETRDRCWRITVKRPKRPKRQKRPNGSCKTTARRARHAAKRENQWHEADLGCDRFCQRRKKDPDEQLKSGDPALFKVYLVFRVKRSRIEKQSSIMTYWKTLSMVYAEKAKTWMSDGILYDIRNVSLKPARRVLVLMIDSGFVQT